MFQFGVREGFDDGMLGYYFVVSVFRGGFVEVNFGLDFWYLLLVDEQNDQMEKFCLFVEWFEEQIVEDIVYDIVDEVDFWMQDGVGVVGLGVFIGKLNEVIVFGGEEIKELV